MPTEESLTISWTLAKDELCSILAAQFGIITTDKLEYISGYNDQNYFVKESAIISSDEYEDGREFVLKVCNEKYSKNTRELDGELCLLAYLRRKGFPVPEEQPTLDGQSYYVVSKDLGESQPRRRIIRLHKFIPGQVLFKAGISSPICRKIGLMLGRMDVAMAELETSLMCPPELKTSIEWDLAHLHILHPLVEFIEDKDRLLLARRALEFAESNILPNMEALPTQAIHGDCNDQNVLVSYDGLDIVGILDFSDSPVSKRVFDPAIALMYLMLFGDDPSSCATSFLNGYLQAVQLTKLERSLLFPCVIGRYAQSLIIGNYKAYKLAQQGISNDYVLHTSKRGWTMLEMLMDSALGKELSELFEKM